MGGGEITSRRFPHKYDGMDRRGKEKTRGRDRETETQPATENQERQTSSEATFQSSHLSCEIDYLNPGHDCLSNISFSALKSIEVRTEQSSHNPYAS